jgi:hypothetical protein
VDREPRRVPAIFRGSTKLLACFAERRAFSFGCEACSDEVQQRCRSIGSFDSPVGSHQNFDNRVDYVGPFLENDPVQLSLIWTSSIASGENGSV